MREKARRSVLRARGLLRGTFREVDILGSEVWEISGSGICVVVDGGIRVEGLDIAGAAALVGMLR